MIYRLRTDQRLEPKDLEAMGQLLSAAGLDERNFGPNQAGLRLVSIHKNLRTKFENLFAPDLQAVSRWHEMQAYEAGLYGHWRSAESHLSAGETQSPADWTLLVRRARARIVLGDEVAARVDLGRALNLSRTDVCEWLAHEAYAASYAGERRTALFLMKTLAEADPTQRDAYGEMLAAFFDPAFPADPFATRRDRVRDTR